MLQFRSSRFIRPILLLTSMLVGCRSTTDVSPVVALLVRPRGSNEVSGINIHIGEDLPLEALPVRADSTRIDTAIAAAWNSTDTTKAVVSAEGVLHTRCVGTTTIRASASVAGRLVTGQVRVSIGSFGQTCA